MSMSLEGKTAIVTGAGHGVGLAIARALYERGAKVMRAECDESALDHEMARFGDDARVRRFSAEMGSATRHTRLGRDNGNRLDYDHINMLTAPQAQEDHFPEILAWLLNPQAA